jgi:hypothetical protein
MANESSGGDLDQSQQLEARMKLARRLAGELDHHLTTDELKAVRRLLSAETTAETARIVRRIEKSLDIFSQDGDEEFASETIRAALAAVQDAAKAPGAARAQSAQRTVPVRPAVLGQTVVTPTDTDTPIDEIRVRADRGNAEAVRVLGLCYLNGIQVGLDYGVAFSCFERAVALGSDRAKLNLGKRYLRGEGTSPDSTIGLKLLVECSEAGFAEAARELGEFHASGRFGLEENMAEAARWYRRAAEQGDAKAQFQLACQLFYGDGVEQRQDEAVEWYRRAAEQEHAEAQWRLAECYEVGWGVDSDEEQARAWFERSAENHSAAGMGHFGRFLIETGDEEEAATGVEWLQKAAEEGDVQAQVRLGECYLCGEGVDEDLEQAASLFRQVADEDERAAYRLGDCLQFGWGVEADLEEAIRWYRRAAASEHPCADAMVMLAECHYFGRGMPVDRVQAFQLIQSAMREGGGPVSALDEADGILGMCLLHGHGTEVDPVEAVRYLERAVKVNPGRWSESLEKARKRSGDTSRIAASSPPPPPPDAEAVERASGNGPWERAFGPGGSMDRAFGEGGTFDRIFGRTGGTPASRRNKRQKD